MLLIGAALSGCAHAQLNSNTVDLAQSLDFLYRNQALINLSRLIDDPNTLPSQVDITSGQVQTQTQASGSGTFPLGSQVVQSLPSGAAAGTALSLSQITEQFRSLMFGLNNMQQQGWSINPAMDLNALMRLRALYRYVIHYDYKYYENLYTHNTRISELCSNKFDIDCINAAMLKISYNLNVIAKNNNLVIDLSRLLEPQCVLCLRTNKIYEILQDKNNREVEILNSYLTIIYNDKGDSKHYNKEKKDTWKLSQRQQCTRQKTILMTAIKPAAK